MRTENISPLLSLDHVSKTRRHQGRNIPILHDLSLSLPEGRMNLFIGPSGGGKSTLLRLLNRLEEPSFGRILYRGTSLAELSPVALRRDLAMVMQKPVMFAGTVLANLQKSFALRREPPPGATDAQLQRVLQQCRLDEALLDREARSLSLGQQQRVSLARVLLTGPRVLLLDEPTSALDRPTADQLAQTLLSLNREHGLTVVMATHDLRLAAQLADELYYLEAGRVLEQGSRAALLNNPQTPQLQRFLAEPDFSAEQAAEGEA